MTDYASPDRAAYPVMIPMTTRWRDDDVYGHMNNVVYYEYFDSAVAMWLRESGALPVPSGSQIGLVVETSCRFLASVGFPDRLEIGVSTIRVGRTSVIYGLALFREGAAEAAALCRFVHVYVDAETRRPEPLSERMTEKLRAIAAPAA